MQENIVKKANRLFSEKKYLEARELYIKASKIFGTKIFEFNLDLCNKRINPTSKVVDANVDSITKILLSNAGRLTLAEAERLDAIQHYKSISRRKSASATVKPVNTVPADWPSDLTLAPLPASTNDFDWHMLRRGSSASRHDEKIGLSIIVPVFNRSAILDITLACLNNQQTKYQFEVIVSDDGSQEDLTLVTRTYENLLDIKYVRQKDYGYQLCAIRNLGLRCAKYDYVAILDCDMAPNRLWVDSYMKQLLKCDDIALIGPRKYIDTCGTSADAFLKDMDLLEKLPEIITNNSVAGRIEGEVSVDWRLKHFTETEDLRLCNTPFRFFSGGNVAFARKWLSIAGWFDEEFTHWGGEDNEYGYRLYRAGCFFKAEHGGLAYHQEPPGKENETDREGGKAITIKIVEQKVPYYYRKLEPIEISTIKKVPLVSIYIPAYNCKNFIERCVNSALNQTITDLEVCICDDGSTDGTLETIRSLYASNPRVQIISRKNGGIAAASNAAVRLCRGYYIGQLDSDDYLEPDAVEHCLQEFFKNRNLACTYTTNRNVDANLQQISDGYNWPVYSREKLTTAMICHHFRMFTARAWNLTAGFDENIINAVDYDIYLKLSEIGPFHHINKICYNRVLHGENTSIKKLAQQKENHFKVVNFSLQRQGVIGWEYQPKDKNDDHSRLYSFTHNNL